MKVFVSGKMNTDVRCDVLVLAGNGPPPERGEDGRCVISPPYKEDGFLCVRALLPSGTVTLRALTPGAGYRGDEDARPAVFRAGGVLCAVTAGGDAFRPEIFRYLAYRGVRVVFCMLNLPDGEGGRDAVMFGPWSNAQANNLFVVSVSDTRCDVMAPCGLTADGSGFIVENAAPGFPAEIPADRYYEGQRSFPVFRSMNTPLYSRYFGGRIRQAPVTRVIPDGLKVSAVCFALRPMVSREEYRGEIEELYRSAAAEGSRLIVFPELFGITPLCFVPGIRRIFTRGKGTWEEGPADRAPCTPASLRLLPGNGGAAFRLLRLLSGPLRGINAAAAGILSEMSAKYGMYTASGSSLEFIGGKLYNVQTLYGPDGKVIGRQKKVNPMEPELAAGVNYAEEISVFETEIGRIAIPVCMDASYPENFRILRGMGADIIAIGTFNMEEYNGYLALRGIVPRCTEYSLHAVKSAMNGFVRGIPVTGRAELAVPSREAEGGILCFLSAAEKSGVVTGRLFPESEVPERPFRANIDAPVLTELLKETFLHKK